MPDTSDICELERSLALILTNSHIALNGVKPITPALAEVDGLHIQDDDSVIPVNHKKWLDESKDDFIYFTFGAMVTIESFPRKHRNIRGFSTHGGLMSTQETILCAVPMIGMPLNVDLFLNIDLYVKKGIAIRLDYRQLTEAKLDVSLNEVLRNPVYRAIEKQVLTKSLDRSHSAMDTACYWIEYVIGDGSKAFRSPAFDFPWWQVH